MSPLEIPGDILKELPDKNSKGTCRNRNCRRPYYKVKIHKEGGKITLHCPYCGRKVTIGKGK